MKLKEYQIVLAAVFLPLFLLWGCQSNKLISPGRGVNMSGAISTKGVQAKLFNETQDLGSYNISGPLSSPVTGIEGPFSTGAGPGTIGFTLNNVPVGAGEILSVEIDANTIGGTPQGIGATSLADVSNGVTVDMGSLVRSCYAVNPSTNFSWNSGPIQGGFYTFNGDFIALSALTFTYDIQWAGFVQNSIFAGYDVVDGWTGSAHSIAYLGNSQRNGELVNFDIVPTDANFYADAAVAKQAAAEPTTLLESGDMYCVKL